MYRFKNNELREYLIADNLIDLYLALPEDVNKLRELFELSITDNINGMFDKIISEEDSQSTDDIGTLGQSTIKIGWHSSFELFFEATSLSPKADYLPLDREKYQSFISSMLSAKHGVPFGNKYTKLIAVAHNIVSHYPEFYNTFKSICYYYGHYDELKAQDKKGKLLKKEEFHSNKINIPDPIFNEIIEFLCPALNGRLLYAQQYGHKAESDAVLEEFFHPVKFFSMLLNPDTPKLDSKFAQINNVEIFALIKRYLTVRSGDNIYNGLETCNKEVRAKIKDFITNSYVLPEEYYQGLYVRSGTEQYEQELDEFVKYMHLYDLGQYISNGLYEDKNGTCLYIESNYKGLDDFEKITVESEIRSLLKDHISYYDFDGYTN